MAIVIRDHAFLKVDLSRKKLNGMKVRPKRADFGLGPVNQASEVACLVNHDIALSEISVKQHHGQGKHIAN
jgi:hypothetical protein